MHVCETCKFQKTKNMGAVESLNLKIKMLLVGVRHTRKLGSGIPKQESELCTSLGR